MKLNLSKKSGLLTRILLIGLLSLVLLLVLGLVAFAVLVNDLPRPEALASRQIAESTKIFDREEEVLLYELFEEERRTVIAYEEIPRHVKEATIAIEDENFYDHAAIDIPSVIRALFVNLKSGTVKQGGSTITQQLAKNAFLSPEKTLVRKARELILALRLEKQFTKDEILHLYLNQIPYGGNAYGIESATRTYFQKPATELTLPEAALLVSLPQAPSYYSPWGSHVDDLMERKDLVLDQMYKLGYISAEERDEAKAYQFEMEQPASSVLAPHFSIAVAEYLNEKYGEEFVRRAGLRVVTTLNWDLQEIAEKAVQEGVARNTELYNGTNGALVAQDTDTGQILALVGSKDYFAEDFDGNFNVATQGLRQPGSAMKPFVYLTALKNGFTTESVVFDLKTEFDLSGRGSYQPNNFDNIFRGPVTFRRALAQSINVPAVKVLYMAGMDNVLSLMKDFGVSTLTERSRYGLSLVLGGGEVKLIELLGAYATLAEEGLYRPQSMIIRIEDKNGIIIEEFEEEATRVVAPEYPRMINDILTDLDMRAGLFQSSFGLTVFSGHDVALKTGTTNDYRDAWAFGYTPNLAVGVWAGNNDNTPMSTQGSSILAAIPMWNAFLKDALKDRPAETFPRAAQEFSEKPMLSGQHIVYYEANGQLYPQVHNILYYVNKVNPRGPEPQHAADGQFQNWEVAVLAWARNNIADFSSYNQPIPSGARIVSGPGEFSGSGSSSGSGDILFFEPRAGQEIGESFDVKASIKLKKEIESIKLYFNNRLVDEREGFLGSEYSYEARLHVGNLKSQNKLKIVVEDEDGKDFEQEIILFEKE
ncbi:MAG: PBP1A family penicillin-binding protein [Candidatus Harrisonbacteria bacterium]|nr:PBP1A family penicillin-binding protein [Candidatus Harrisonbacteria bacterium]